MKPFMARRRSFLFLLLFVLSLSPRAQTAAQVVDIPTRPGVTQRFLYLAPDKPRAAVILLAGGHGGLQIFPNGSVNWGDGNFLVRTRDLFRQQGLAVAVVDAPSDRQSAPFLNGFRQTPEHVADLKAVIGWMRDKTGVPVWLVGTSRGTQSAAWISTQLPRADGGPDGLVLTSTILSDPRGRPVPAMPLDRVTVPVLVVHHQQDGCKQCPFSETSGLMEKFTSAPRKELIPVSGGISKGDPCEAWSHHGYNGLETEVVDRIAAWITAH
ncbi:Alpha/beta hydrolase family protein [Variovorax sp. HW608]|uniref:alpha/beta hydrolase n=1 Tax=Variovorax sp. HW608 TaxID=1034889 RepID=UPI00081FAA40|nr:alpha/beta hydrolase [Variovorax sp. HW608]SCK26219.1 Alpha/beta hydrolase family protein [Variovorax sp. HW608]